MYINEWDGNSVEIKEDEGYIYAPQIGAGHKEIDKSTGDNTFTGVIMGEYVIDTQMGWNILKKEGSSNQYYCSMTGFENGVGVCRLIEIESDNWDNMKVVNIVNKIIDNTTGSSF